MTFSRENIIALSSWFFQKVCHLQRQQKYGGNLSVGMTVDCHSKILNGQGPKVKISFIQKRMGMLGCGVHWSHKPGVLTLASYFLKKKWVRSTHAEEAKIIFPLRVQWKSSMQWKTKSNDLLPFCKFFKYRETKKVTGTLIMLLLGWKMWLIVWWFFFQIWTLSSCLIKVVVMENDRKMDYVHDWWIKAGVVHHQWCTHHKLLTSCVLGCIPRHSWLVTNSPWHLASQTMDLFTYQNNDAKKAKNPATGDKKQWKLKKSELINALEAKLGITFLSTNHRMINELHILASNHRVAINIEEDEIIQGWMNKPKGLLQILWEQGWILPSENLNKYVNKNWLDAHGKVLPEFENDANKFILTNLLSSCSNFKDKKSAIQKIAEDLYQHHQCDIELLAGEGLRLV